MTVLVEYTIHGCGGGGGGGEKIFIADNETTSGEFSLTLPRPIVHPPQCTGNCTSHARGN